MSTQTMQFQLTDISTEEFAKFEENYIANRNVNLSNNFSFSVDENQKLVICEITIDSSIKNKIFLKIKVRFMFLITEESWYELVSEDKKHIIFPKNLIVHFFMLSMGTIRGIVHEKLKDLKSEMSQYILPLINISDVITEDVIISIAEKINKN